MPRVTATSTRKWRSRFCCRRWRESPESCQRFAAEARTALRLESEHVVRVHDVAAVDGAPFIVMEYRTGDDLSKVIAARGRLPVAEAVDLRLQAREAIADAHNLGIVHRDLEPANVFVTAGSDERAFVKVLDFGISKSAAHPSVTASAAVVGAPLSEGSPGLLLAGEVPVCGVSFGGHAATAISNQGPTFRASPARQPRPGTGSRRLCYGGIRGHPVRPTSPAPRAPLQKGRILAGSRDSEGDRVVVGRRTPRPEVER